ncbi:MAG TPA: hypothetical protein VF257_18485 [Solirubrobacteraceae bacterium]
MLKIAVAAVAAACLALPALAPAEDHAPAVDHLTCGDGTTLTPPLSPPVCREHGGVASVTCVSGATLTPPLDGKRCPATRDDEGAPPNDDQQPAADGTDDDRGERAQHGDAPRLQAGFLNRVWRIAGSAGGFEDGVLDFTADRFVKLPRRFASQDDAVVGEDARVLVSPRTRVFDADHHRLTGDAMATALDDADAVVVVGKLLRPAKWQQDEDGTPVPTLRAKKIIVKS